MEGMNKVNVQSAVGTMGVQNAVGNVAVQNAVGNVGVQSAVGNVGNQMAIQNNGLQNQLQMQGMQQQKGMQGIQQQMQMQGMQQQMMMQNMMNNMNTGNAQAQTAQALMNQRIMEKMAPTPDLIEFGTLDCAQFMPECALGLFCPCVASHLISKSFGDSAGCCKYVAWHTLCGWFCGAELCYSPGVTQKMNMKHGLHGEGDQCIMHALCHSCELGRELHYINLVQKNLVRSAVSDGPPRQELNG